MQSERDTLTGSKMYDGSHGVSFGFDQVCYSGERAFGGDPFGRTRPRSGGSRGMYSYVQSKPYLASSVEIVVIAAAADPNSGERYAMLCAITRDWAPPDT